MSFGSGFTISAFLISGVVVSGLLADIGPAKAQSRSQQEQVCLRLENSLATLQRNRNSRSRRAQFEKYDRASHKQRAKVDRLRREAKRENCGGGGFLFFRKQPGPQCKSINVRLRKEIRKLDGLLDKRNQFASSRRGRNSQQRDLLEALARNRCGPQYERYARRSRGPTLFGLRLFGEGDRRFRSGSFNREFYNDQFASVGTYRTLCVRRCDGYYFPISFSTLQRNFSRDEAVCQNMCPAADVSLYIHRNPGEESEDMVSLEGEPYNLLPTAFNYRKEYNSACTCGKINAPTQLFASGSEPINASIVGGTFRLGDAFGDPSIPIPDLRLDPAQDPETRLSLVGGFSPKVLNDDEDPLVAQRGGKTIRIVGPQYYYGRSVAEVDQAPDRATVQ